MERQQTKRKKAFDTNESLFFILKIFDRYINKYIIVYILYIYLKIWYQKFFV